MEILEKLRKCSRPVVFKTENENAPYSTAGTAFLVGFGQSIFILTARHVVKDWPVEKVLICPSWNSSYAFHFLGWWFVEKDTEAPDASDVLIIKAELNDIPTTERKEIEILDLNPSVNLSWFHERHDSQFFLCGFPLFHSKVDYSTLEIKTQQYFLEGVYAGESPFVGCHEIKVNNPLNLQDFNGLSGSPVFSHRHENGEGTPGKFCGMALRGSVMSGSIHFLGADVLMSVLAKIEG